MKANTIFRKLKAQGDPLRAQHVQKYFKTGPGEYGEGDKFLGNNMPDIRKLSKQAGALEYAELLLLLQNRWHEARILALLILVERYKSGDDKLRKRIYLDYLKHSKWINNWDLVDCSAHLIVGPWLENRSHAPLFKLAKSTLLWDRRIAIMSTFHFVRQRQFATTIKVVEGLLNDEQDLIHKACGWMLRETGRRDKVLLCSFLDAHVQDIPRTMLRYSIEHFSAPERKKYLAL